MARILLNNPDTPVGPLKRSNTYDHGSKDYVKKLIKAIEKSNMERNVIASITSHSYSSHKRKTIQIHSSDKKGMLGLIITGPDDKGFAAEITLYAEEYWQALLHAKYLVGSVRMLKDYTIKT